MDIKEHSLQLSELQSKLETISRDCRDQLDPAGFCYLQSLLEKAATHRSAVKDALLKKAEQAIDEYLRHTEKLSNQALRLSDEINKTYPHAEIQTELFTSQDTLHDLQKLAKKLKHEEAKKERSSNSLQSITAQLNQEAKTPHAEQSGFSFDDTLRQQELDWVNTLSPREPQTSDNDNGVMAELRAMRAFRDSREKINADKLVTRLIKDGPETPGPLNPHSLAIRALSNMRDISPHYLKRMITHIDTLLWLDKAANRSQIPAPKPKKRKRS